MENYFGRKEELQQLAEIFDGDRFEFGYVYGQRRIGKTTLMQMFAQGRKTLFLFATDSEDIENRAVFSRELDRMMNRKGGIYPDWSSFFEAVESFLEMKKDS